MSAAPIPSSRHRLAWLAMCGGGLGIGAAPILVRFCFEDVGPSATAFYRLLLAWPLLGCWLALDRRHRPECVPPIRARDLPGFALTGLLFTGDLSFWHWSLKHTTVANSTLLANLAPILVTAGAWLLYRESITLAFLLGLFLAVSGASLLVGWSVDVGAHHVWGHALALIAAVFYAAYLLSVKRLRRRFSSLQVMTWSGPFAIAGFLTAAWFSGEDLQPVQFRTWLALAALAGVSHLGGQTLIAYALGHLPASFSSLGLLIQPVVAAALAWILFKEALGWWQLAGALLVLAGIAVAAPRRQ